MLSKRITAALLAGLVFASGAYAQMSLKDKSPETAKALKFSQEAVAAGQQGQADALVAKAEEAQKQAIYASKAFTSYNLQIALERLNEAVGAGKKGDVKTATEKAQAAVDVLESAAPTDPNLP
jgi:hypothetical protein